MPTRPAMRYRHLIQIALLAGAMRLLAPPPSPAGDQMSRRTDPAARLSSAPAASEVWNLTARLDGGYRLFTWFFITNEGPGTQSAAAIWYLVHPDGRVAEFRNGRLRGHWKLSPDRRRIDVASSSLDLRGPVYRVAIDSTSQRAKIDLQFPADAAPPWAATASPTSLSSTSTLRTDTLEIAAPVEGTIWDGSLSAPVVVRGAATLTHAWMDESLPRIVQRRTEFFTDQPGLAFYLSDITAPSGDNRRWLALERGGTGYTSTVFEMMLDPSVLPIADRNYPLPARLVVRDSRISVEIQPQRLLVRRNPLAVLPQPFRFIYSFRLEPQWVWLDASFHLQLAAEGASTSPPLSVDGRGILAVTFVNPLHLAE